MTRFILTMAALLVILSSPAAAQETSSAADLRAAIEDLRDGTIDEVAAVSRVIDAYRKDRKKTREYLNRLGPLENITFWDTFGNSDLYLVSFEFGRVVYAMRRNENGEIRGFSYRIVRLVR